MLSNRKEAPTDLLIPEWGRTENPKHEEKTGADWKPRAGGGHYIRKRVVLCPLWQELFPFIFSLFLAHPIAAKRPILFCSPSGPKDSKRKVEMSEGYHTPMKKPPREESGLVREPGGIILKEGPSIKQRVEAAYLKAEE